VDALTQLSIDGGTVEQVRTALVGRIGENITVRRFARLQAKGRLASYVHGGSKIGVMVDLVGGDDTLARDLAMHIAASKPRALSREGVPAADVERERSIAQQKADEEQAKAKAEGKAGKPPEIVAKMVDGAVQKYLKEVTLLGQPFVKDDKQTVEQLLKARGAQVAQFALFVVGDPQRDHAFGRDARGRLARLVAQLHAQDFLGAPEIAAGLGQRLLALHHRRVGLLAQFLDHAGGNRRHR